MVALRFEILQKNYKNCTVIQKFLHIFITFSRTWVFFVYFYPKYTGFLMIFDTFLKFSNGSATL